jgi:uncharacterized DUF497 family protein
MPPITFHWDKGNESKSEHKHGITNIEAESVFDDPAKKIVYDSKHSAREIRYVCIGKSQYERILFVSYLIRQGMVRIVGARLANKKNRESYEKAP